MATLDSMREPMTCEELVTPERVLRALPSVLSSAGSAVELSAWLLAGSPTASMGSLALASQPRICNCVAGVSDRVLSFLVARRRSRRWLHGATTFTLLNWFIGLPASFWLIYRLDSVTQRLTSGFPSALRVGVYVYIFLLVLLAFRALIYILRWLFPIIELEGSRSKAARATGGVIALGLVTALIYDVLKAAFK